MVYAVASWINRKSAFVLAFLLIFIGLVLGLTHALVHLHAPSMQSASRGGTAHCGEISVLFQPATTAQKIQETMLQYGASITDGPDENGAYHLHFPGLTISDAITAIERAGIASRVIANNQCEAGASSSEGS